MFKALVKKNTAIAIVTDYAHDVEELSTLAKLRRAVALYLALQNFDNEEFPSMVWVILGYSLKLIVTP